MSSRTLYALALGIVLGVAGGPAEAANPSVLNRHFQSGPTYGYHPRYGCQDCQAPWQPIRSVMHDNVLPPGMHRPWPLRIPAPSLAPRTPDFGCDPAAGYGLWPAFRLW